MRKLILKLATILFYLVVVKNANTQTLTIKTITTDSSQLQNLSALAPAGSAKNSYPAEVSIITKDFNNTVSSQADYHVFDTLYFFENIFLKTPTTETDSIQMTKALGSLKKYMQKMNNSLGNNIVQSILIKTGRVIYQKIPYCKRVE